MISSLLALSSSLLLAVASPLQTADDYVFTKPAFSNAIKGVVMGETGDYGTIRYEDIAFLNEAFTELDLTRWSGLTSNSFVNEVEYERSNSIPKSVEIKKGSSHVYFNPDPFLFNAEDISTHPRMVLLTNQVEKFLFSASTNLYAMSANTIEQVMTNGTVNVWTNSWPNRPFSSNTVVRTSRTNTISLADFCMNDHVVTFHDIEKSYRANNLNGPYSISKITNLYAIAKAMRHSVPEEAAEIPPPLNATQSYYYKGVLDYTSSITSTVYSVDSIKSHNFGHEQKWDDDSKAWEDIGNYDRTSSYRTLTFPNNLDIKAIASYPDIYTTLGTSTPRISNAQAFALVTTDYQILKTADASGHDDVEVRTNLSSQVMIPLGNCERTSPINEKLTFEISVPLNIYKTAAEFSSIPFLEKEHVPDLLPAMTPEWRNGGYETRYKSSSEHSEERLYSDFEIYLILELNPKTDL